MYKSEHDFQKDVFLHVNTHYPIFRRRLYAIPNGDQRGETKEHAFIIGNRLKNEGVTAGVHDMALHIGGKSTFIEMKKNRSGKMSKGQKRQEQVMFEEGFPVYLVKGDKEQFFQVLNCAIMTNRKIKELMIKDETLEFIGLDRSTWEYDTKVFKHLFDMGVTYDKQGRVIKRESTTKEITSLSEEIKEKYIKAVKKFVCFEFDWANGFSISFNDDYTKIRKTFNQEFNSKYDGYED